MARRSKGAEPTPAPAVTPRRKAAIFNVAGRDVVIQTWTLDEFRALPADARPAWAAYLGGVGCFSAWLLTSPAERAEILALMRAAKAEDERGPTT